MSSSLVPGRHNGPEPEDKDSLCEMHEEKVVIPADMILASVLQRRDEEQRLARSGNVPIQQKGSATLGVHGRSSPTQHLPDIKR